MICPKEIEQMILTVIEMSNESHELISKINKIEENPAMLTELCLDKVISIFSKHNTIIIPAYLKKCKNWGNLNLSQEHREQLKLVERFLLDLRNDNDETLCAAKKCKRYFTDNISKKYVVCQSKWKVALH